MGKVRIAEAQTVEKIAHCFPVMWQLRTHFDEKRTFVEQVERQRQTGYRMAFVADEEAVRAVAGYRMMESLYAGRFLLRGRFVTRAHVRNRAPARQFMGSSTIAITSRSTSGPSSGQ